MKLSSCRNPYSGPEEREGDVEASEDTAEASEHPKGKKNKNKDKGQKDKKNKPIMIDVDLGLSAYANSKK